MSNAVIMIVVFLFVFDTGITICFWFTPMQGDVFFNRDTNQLKKHPGNPLFDEL